MVEGQDIIEESITALGHLYGGIKGTQAAGQLNDGHYVNKKTGARASRAKGRPEVKLLNQVASCQQALLRTLPNHRHNTEWNRIRTTEASRPSPSNRPTSKDQPGQMKVTYITLLSLASITFHNFWWNY